MFYAENLLRNGFFPAELPPCFNTNDLADNCDKILDLCEQFKKDYSIPYTYSGYKGENSRRKFGIINPYHYCRAVKFVVDKSSDIFSIFDKSNYSLTAPIKKKPTHNKPYETLSKTVNDTRKHIECLYQNNKYEIKLDINSFFDNIYTHSIPWAIHGKATAKNNKNSSLWGNELDFLVRGTNYNQTNGIIVGNSFSRIISEIILCTIDAKIKKKFNDIECKRFVDDYYIYTTDSGKIQNIISFIRSCLSEYELSLNSNKLKISESPFLYGKPWVEQIKQFIHLKPDVFINKIIIEFNNFKDVSILRYGLKVIAHQMISNDEWSAFESKLLNLLVKFPSLSDVILTILIANKEKLHKNALKKVLYSIIDETIDLNQEQELVWAIWYFKVFNIDISIPYIEKVFQSKYSLPIIILLDIIEKKGLKTNNKISKRIKELHDFLANEDMDSNSTPNNLLWTQFWLLSYESTRNKWLKYKDHPFEYAKKNQFFKKLLQLNIKFYDENFEYKDVSSSSSGIEFVTRKEVYQLLGHLRKLINSVKSKEDSIDEESKSICNKIVELLNDENSQYS